MLSMHSMLDENESQTISKRTKQSFQSLAKNGQFIGSNAPYGYKSINKKLIIRNEKYIAIINEIFDMYLDGKGEYSIANYLLKKGYKTPSMVAGKRNASSKWYGSTVKLILKNEAYIGNLVQNKKVTHDPFITERKIVPKNKQIRVQNTHEAMISQEKFLAVQEIIKSKQRNGSQKNLNRIDIFLQDFWNALSVVLHFGIERTEVDTYVVPT